VNSTLTSPGNSLLTRTEAAPAYPVQLTGVGSALVLHSADGRGPSASMCAFADFLAAEHSWIAVVVDPRVVADRQLCQAAATVLAELPENVRLVAGAPVNCDLLTLAEAAARLSGRAVLAHDGLCVPRIGGELHIPSDSGRGWLRCEPGRGAVRYSRRLPSPDWECAELGEEYGLDGNLVIEPIPAGAWIHARSAGSAASAVIGNLRSQLTERMPVDRAVPRLVLGGPDGCAAPAVAARIWRALPEPAQFAARFSVFGLDRVAGLRFGQELADAVDAAIVVGLGVPMAARSAAGGQELRALGADGLLRSSAGLEEFGFLPAVWSGGCPQQPVPVGAHTHEAVPEPVPAVTVRMRKP
jgi:hypothetical protein